MSIRRYHDNHAAALHRQLYDLPTHYPESRNLQTALGNNLIGQRCLDLGCGVGHWTRLMHSMLAKEVIGIDPLQANVDAAKALTQPLSPNISYQNSSATIISVRQLGVFDVVVTSTLPSTSKFEALRALLTAIAGVLDTNGRIFALLPDHDFCIRTGLSPPAGLYGLGVTPISSFEVRNFGVGWNVKRQYSTKPPLETNACLLPREAFEAAARDAGLGCVEWIKPIVSEELKQSGAGFKPGFWKEWEERPPFVLFSCRKEDTGIAGLSDVRELAGLREMRMSDDGHEIASKEGSDDGSEPIKEDVGSSDEEYVV